MRHYKEHLIPSATTIRETLIVLDNLGKDALLFVTDDNKKLIGSLSDGDVRRGLIRNLSADESVTAFMNPSPRSIKKGNYSLPEIIELRNKDLKIIPVVDQNGEISNVINFNYFKSYLPVDAIIMAGGKGTRLRPLTWDKPKPLLPVGDKTIIDHVIDRLNRFGVDDFYITVNYLSDKIEQYLGNGKNKNIHIEYIKEEKPLGTVGAVSFINNFKHDHVIIINCDILTNINYEHFMLDFISRGADMSVVTIPYKVEVPYAVVETSDQEIISFQEKPTYTYYSNAGIYLIKAELLKEIPANEPFHATDLMQKLIGRGHNIISFPLRQYWLDIGKPEDYEKAQEDIKHIDLS